MLVSMRLCRRRASVVATINVTRQLTTLLLFPGQGCQTVLHGQNLGKTSSIANNVISRAEDVLIADYPNGFFRDFVWNPATTPAQLAQTEVAQPLILICSVAQFQSSPPPLLPTNDYIAIGHSLGEFSALVAAESISLQDAIRVVRIRGLAMRDAVKTLAFPTAMYAILGLSVHAAKEIHAEARAIGMVCEFSASNGPHQQVLAGSMEGVKWGINQATKHGAKRAFPLAVSAPFHTSLMQPASHALEEILNHINIARPTFPIVFNATASMLSEPNDIRKALIRGVYETVRFTECVNAVTITSGVTTSFMEYAGGGSPVLSRILETWSGGGREKQFKNDSLK